MIKPNELRIGNFVFDDENDFCRISALYSTKKIKHEQYEEEDIQVEYDNDNGIYLTKVINAIPLTPGILEKCGFIINMTGTAWWSDNEVLLIGQNGDYFYYGEWGGDSDEPTVDEKIQLKSLHQLQNLYFALTGNELDINL